MYRVKALPAENGWSLHIADLGVSWVRQLRNAEAQVRTFLDLAEVDSAATFEIYPDLGTDLLYKIRWARKVREEAERLFARAGSDCFEAASELRATGLSISDIATVMDTSPHRISRLLALGMVSTHPPAH